MSDQITENRLTRGEPVANRMESPQSFAAVFHVWGKEERLSFCSKSSCTSQDFCKIFQGLRSTSTCWDFKLTGLSVIPPYCPSLASIFIAFWCIGCLPNKRTSVHPKLAVSQFTFPCLFNFFCRINTEFFSCTPWMYTEEWRCCSTHS